LWIGVFVEEKVLRVTSELGAGKGLKRLASKPGGTSTGRKLAKEAGAGGEEIMICELVCAP
jgi:hypothetical protein